jgi:hypothetical protein
MTMTDNELNEVRGLIEEWAELRGADFYLPPRILELVGLPAMAIALLREDAAGHRQHGSRMMNHDQRCVE